MRSGQCPPCAVPARHFKDRTSLLTTIAAWSLAHGFATLPISHDLDGQVGG
ncbi:hypothetical protein [Streptomyces triticiradicis]|uniref:hypothetical protein n=1 Tax=Streptomyces triticiradicis TaxID=2651189 RepID=UPI00298E86E6|nr:hypothetical protein [Streptomyces triticiradicis]